VLEFLELDSLGSLSLQRKNLCHLVLATRAFIDALIMPWTVGKDANQQHSCAALGTRWTGDYPRRIANIRSHFFLPTLQIGLSAADQIFWITYDYTPARLISTK
jgi:hypothetical protein